jgi:hypothetical protein
VVFVYNEGRCAGLPDAARAVREPGREGIRHTRLDSSLLSLVHGELLQFLLVAVGQLAQVGVAETAT